MEKFIYKGQDITEIIKEKEKDIIELYAQQRKIPYDVAEVIYSFSNLKTAIRHVDNDLWTQSEQYIVAANADVLDDVDIERILNAKPQININVDVNSSLLTPWQKRIQEYMLLDNYEQLRPKMLLKESEQADVGVMDFMTEEFNEMCESLRDMGNLQSQLLAAMNENMFDRFRQNYPMTVENNNGSEIVFDSEHEKKSKKKSYK